MGNFPFLLRWETREPVGGRKRLATQDTEVLPMRFRCKRNKQPPPHVAVPAVRWAFTVTAEMEEGGFEKRRQFQFKGPGEAGEGWRWGDITVSCCGLLGALMV